MPGGCTLAQLLAERRGYCNTARLPKYELPTILHWADAHKRRSGRYPKVKSGPIQDAPGETWNAVGSALVFGTRGLTGGSSLAILLATHRGYRNTQRLPHYRVRAILNWADAHNKRNGRFPTQKDGPIDGAPGETWMAVEMALSHGKRGLSGGSSLAKLLAKHRGARNIAGLPRLTVDRILLWADQHKLRTGNWPTRYMGPIVESPGDTWRIIDKALRRGSRGLRGGSSLPQLLVKQRGVRRHIRHPPLNVAKILRWADAHKKRTGRWPNVKSGPIAEAPGETWGRVQMALRQGKRGLLGRCTLAKLLIERRGVRSVQHLPKLSELSIIKWIADYQRRWGQYPTQKSGSIPNSDGENWMGVNNALYHGLRGFRRGSSLARLIRKHFPART